MNIFDYILQAYNILVGAVYDVADALFGTVADALRLSSTGSNQLTSFSG